MKRRILRKPDKKGNTWKMRRFIPFTLLNGPVILTEGKDPLIVVHNFLHVIS
jgi:hypothetical protein